MRTARLDRTIEPRLSTEASLLNDLEFNVVSVTSKERVLPVHMSSYFSMNDKLPEGYGYVMQGYRFGPNLSHTGTKWDTYLYDRLLI